MKIKMIMALCIIVTFCLHEISGNDFQDYIRTINSNNPTTEAKKKLGEMQDSLQPYYVCDNPEAGSSISPSTWHYSCKQSCTSDQAKHHVNISRVHWEFLGHEIPVFKISTSLVCYTSHENMWGACSQSQTITPDKTTDDDISAIPKDLLSKDKGITGTRSIINSKNAPCEYFADNTVCGRDYVITRTNGKLSRKADSDPMVLNIYSDGLRTDPWKKKLRLGDAMWVWDYDKTEDTKDCGWAYAADATCRYTETSDILYCPDIGYQYVVKNLTAKTTCNLDIYDIDGPAPFQFKNKGKLSNMSEVTSEALKGKSDPDIHLIQGINLALEEIEETYCSSSCDLFSRGGQSALDVVLDTPIGTWRMGLNKNNKTVMTPCTPTVTWRVKSPTTMCHGKNHLLVEDSRTKHTCSWDTTKEYITAEELCTGTDKENAESLGTLRRDMSNHLPITIDFWTGDTARMDPPYDHVTWEKSNISYNPNPSWFSKVKLTKDMLHTQEDLSGLLTSMATDIKGEIYYNKTNKRTMRTLLIEEITEGAGSVFSTMSQIFLSIITNLPKAIFLILIVVGGLWLASTLFSIYTRSKVSAPLYKTVLFKDVPEQSQPSNRVNLQKRSRSRTRMVSNELQNLNI